MIVTRDELPDQFDLCAIDADILVYQCAFSAQKNKYKVVNTITNKIVEDFSCKKEAKEYLEDLVEFYGEDTSELEVVKELEVGTVQEAYEAVDTLVSYIKKKVKAKEYKLYLTDSESNYRNSVSVTRVYKGNRLDLEKPRYYLEVKEYLKDKYGAYMVMGQEADDAVSVLGCLKSKDTCVATIDKDLSGSPIIIYNFSRDEWYNISEEEADLFFFTQCLTGDATDNIEGLPNLAPKTRSKYNLGNRKGVGKKTAEKVLEGCTEASEMFDRVLEAYQDFLGDEEGLKRLNEMGKLLWMQRKKGEVFDVSWFLKG